MTSPNPARDGWKLVPLEPTAEMMDAAIAVVEKPCFPQDIYAAMLTAAPAAKPPAIAADAGALADLIDSVAKCHSGNAMDQAFLDNSDEIATAVLKLFADRDGEWACTVNRLEDRIEGLNADLESAVEVAFRRGAAEWTRLNYPTLHMRLSDPASLSPAATSGSEAGGDVLAGWCQPNGITKQAQYDIDQAIGGTYELPDGRSFWLDHVAVKEIMRRAIPYIAAECERHRLIGGRTAKPAKQGGC